MSDNNPEVTRRLSPALVWLSPRAKVDIDGLTYRVGPYIENNLDSPHYNGRVYTLIRQGRRFWLEIVNRRGLRSVVLIQLSVHHASYPPEAYRPKDDKPVTIDGKTYRPEYGSTMPYRTPGGTVGEEQFIMFTDKHHRQHPRLTLVKYGQGNWVLTTSRELHIASIRVL